MEFNLVYKERKIIKLSGAAEEKFIWKEILYVSSYFPSVVLILFPFFSFYFSFSYPNMLHNNRDFSLTNVYQQHTSIYPSKLPFG